MVSTVRNNQIVNLLILLPYTLIVRAHSLLYPKVYEVSSDDSILSRWILSMLGENALFHSILSALLIYCVAVIVANLSNKYRIFQKQNLYGAFFFVLLASLIAEVQMLTPALLGLLFFTLYLKSCMTIYRYHFKEFEIFNVGLFAMLAGLVYPPLMMLLFASLFVILFFEGVDTKAFLLLILGMVSTAIIVLSLFYFFDLYTFSDEGTLGLSKVITGKTYWVWDRIFYCGVVFFWVLFGLAKFYSFQKKKIIDARKRISFLALLTILLVIIPFFFIGSDIHFLLILSLMASFSIALYFDSLKNNIIVEMIHLLLIITLFGFQFNWINI
ncbi:MAG: DUF6427 family protein [Saprospiraceae bacterium]